jgi:hypothetical protein
MIASSNRISCNNDSVLPGLACNQTVTLSYKIVCPEENTIIEQITGDTIKEEW